MDKISEMLPQVKKYELNILLVVHDFCEKYNLKYTLAYGTLLGTIRHGGFIPWDDDIDIWMPREDYERFIDKWNENPIEGYIIQTPYSDKEYTQNFSKIRKDNSTYLQEGEEHLNYHKGIFIDIFPLDRVSKSNIKINMQKIDGVLMQLFARKYVSSKEKGIKKFLSHLILSIVPKSKYDRMKYYFDKRVQHFSSNEGGYKFFGSMMAISKTPYSNNMFDKLKLMTFENELFYVTSNYDEVLTKFYGDYMKLPPVDQRIWAHHPVLIDFEHNYEG